MNWKVPLFNVHFDHGEAEAVRDVVKSGWLTMGERTKEFEQRFAEFAGAKHAIAVAHCTAALHLANQALDVGQGDEVIVPSLTFVASANSVTYVGATPVFADITSQDDLCISPEDIERKITPRTRAIQVMHYGGNPCDMDAITDIAKRKGIPIVEDCAHSPGAYLHGKMTGGFGAAGCFSFFSNKNMTTGEGGMVTTDDDALAERVRSLRSHGMTTLTFDRHRGHAFSYDVLAPGNNYRLDDMRSALGLIQLSLLPGKNAKRARLDTRYRERLAGVKGISVPFAKRRGTSSYHIFPVLLAPGRDRQAFMAAMKERGIQTSIHYPPVHLFSFYKQNHGRGVHLPKTEDIASRLVTLPFFPEMSDTDLEYVCSSIEQIR